MEATWGAALRRLAFRIVDGPALPFVGLPMLAVFLGGTAVDGLHYEVHPKWLGDFATWPVYWAFALGASLSLALVIGLCVSRIVAYRKNRERDKRHELYAAAKRFIRIVERDPQPSPGVLAMIDVDLSLLRSAGLVPPKLNGSDIGFHLDRCRALLPYLERSLREAQRAVRRWEQKTPQPERKIKT